MSTNLNHPINKSPSTKKRNSSMSSKNKNRTVRSQHMNISNENIFCDDSYYKLKLDLSFEQVIEEDNCCYESILVNLELIKYTAIFLLLRTIFNIVCYYSYSYFLTLINLVNAMIIIILIVQLKQNEDIKSRINIFRMFFEIDRVFNFYLFIIDSHEEYLTIRLILGVFLPTLYFNILFSLSMVISIEYYLSNLIILLFLHGHNDSYFTRFVSFKFNFCLVFQYILVLGKVFESYHYYDINNNFPIFIHQGKLFL